MTDQSSPVRPKRPEFRNINAFTDLPSYRLPVAGFVSILHRISGAIMFLLMPFIIWMFDTSVSSEISFERFKALFNVGAMGFFWKLVALALIWAYLHHFFAGIRYLLLDVHVWTAKEPAQLSAKIVLVLGLVATVLVGVRIW